MLQHVGLNLKTVKFFVQHFGCCVTLYSFGHVTQHCWTRACALGPRVVYQGPGAHKHPHVALKVFKVLRASGQPVQHMSLNNVVRGCVEMLRAFGQAFSAKFL